MSAGPDVHDVIARLQKSFETHDWCELKPGEVGVLLRYIGELQLYGLRAAAASAPLPGGEPG